MEAAMLLVSKIARKHFIIRMALRGETTYIEINVDTQTMINTLNK